MSFILEALKKSEKERCRGEVPGLQALATAEASSGALRRFWPLVLLIALLLNAGCLFWWLRPWEKPAALRKAGPTELERSHSAEPLPSEKTTVAAAPIKGTASQASGKAPPGWNELPAPVPAVARVPTWAGADEEISSIPLLGELPETERRALPELAVTLHYYTAAPAARLARINGRILRQGQAVNEQLTVEEITADGIVFRFGQRRFRWGDF